MWLSIISAHRNFLLFLHFSSLLFYIFSIRNFVNYKHLFCPIWSVFLVKCLYLVFLCSHLITNFEFWFLSCMHITKSVEINSSHILLFACFCWCHFNAWMFCVVVFCRYLWKFVKILCSLELWTVSTFCLIVLFYHSKTLDFSSFSVEYIPMLYLFNTSLRCL